MDRANEAGGMSPLQQAAAAIKMLRARLEAAERASAEPIAVIGLSCRFPGADTPTAYWDLLRAGRDAVKEVPPERWDVDAYYSTDREARWKSTARHGGFIDQPLSGFDCDFFGISPREVVSMDPQQRILLEVAWEALEHAGIAPDGLVDSDTGVYVGFLTNDYGQIPFSAVQRQDLMYVGMGNALSFPAGRLSYTLGLQGPSMVVGTACSSSLTSLHLACQALRGGECEMALAGGVSLIGIPDNHIILSKMGALAADGRSKTFDAQANGYSRGEGCGVVVLKRLSDAQADGDRIMAVIRGSAINHDGPSGGITVPNGPAQEKLLRKALRAARMRPDEIDYIEAHGTGTPIGDPIELRALGAVFGRDRETPLLVGSVKTNIGHAEGAAGIASFIKVVLALYNEQIPAHLHINELSPAIPWDEMKLDVPRTLTPWPAEGGLRAAGMSSFGLSGINAHLIVQEAPREDAPTDAPAPAEESPHVLTLSALTPAALDALARRYADALGAPDAPALADVCYTTHVGRAQLKERMAVTAATRAEARERLEAAARGEPTPGVIRRAARPRAKTAFLFTGQGTQYLGMGEALFESEPVFREVFLQCDEILRPALGISLTDLAYPATRDERAADRLLETGYGQPALFALEYALARLWMSRGVTPDYVMGHSFGEYAAACIAGVFDLDGALSIVVERAQLMQALPPSGAMAAIAATPEIAAPALALADGRVVIAAYNGPQSLVLSGPEADLTLCTDALAAGGVRVKRLKLFHAFHSVGMQPIIEPFVQAVSQVTLRPAQIPLISNVGGDVAGDEICSPRYWGQHVLQPVAFDPGLRALDRAGVAAFLEIGPRPTLTSMGGVALEGDHAWIEGLHPEKPDREQLADAAGHLFTAGAAIDWRRFHADRSGRPVALPTYPFQRQDYWIELEGGWDRPDRQESGAHPLLGRRHASPATTRQYEVRLSPARPAFMADHKVYDQIIAPGASFVEIALAAGAELGAPRVEELSFSAALALPDPRSVQTLVSPRGAGGGVEIFSLDPEADADDPRAWTLHAGGDLAPARPGEALDLATLRAEIDQPVSVEDFYGRLGGAGLDYGPAFQGLRAIWRRGDRALGRVALTDGEGAPYTLHPALLDACFQLVGAAIDLPEGGGAWLPASVGAVQVDAPGQDALWAYATVARRPTSFVCEIHLFTPNGAPAGRVERLALRQVDAADLLGAQARKFQSWLYDLAWRSVERPPAGSGAGSARALLLGGPARLVEGLSLGLGAAGWQVASTADAASLSAPAGAGPLHVLDLRALDPIAGEDLPARALARATGALSLIQSLGGGSLGDVSLWLITRGARAAVDGEPVDGIEASPIWGLGRSVARELPELSCRRIDLDPGPRPQDVESLTAELLATDAEDEIAIRGGARYAPRLIRLPQRLPAQPLPLRDDATYLITGGAGALGMKIAERMADDGARHLALLGRSALRGESLERAEALIDRGVRIYPLRADAAEPGALSRALSELAQTAPPVRGVIHSAGVVDDGVLSQLTPDRLARVFAPKVAGGWQLDLATRNMELDFFVLFSSASSLVGTTGQGNYIAANAFLDELAHRRLAAGETALSMNWGGWSERGVAAGELVQRRMERLGVGAIQPDDGAFVFARTHDVTGQLGILPVDWSLLGRQAPAPLYADLLAQAGAMDASEGDLARHLAALPPDQRRRELTERVGQLVNAVVGRPLDAPIDPDQGFFEMGLDSLMSVELRNGLQRSLDRSLPATLAFDSPTLRELVDFLITELVGEEEVSDEPTDEPDLSFEDHDLSALLADVAELDDDAVQAFLHGD